MAIEGISISLEQVLETARNIKSLNTQIVTRLNEIKSNLQDIGISIQIVKGKERKIIISK